MIYARMCAKHNTVGCEECGPPVIVPDPTPPTDIPDAAVVDQLAQALRDANTPEAWTLGPQIVPLHHFAQVTVSWLTERGLMALPVGTRVIVDLVGEEKLGEIADVVVARTGVIWEYDVLLDDGRCVATQPRYVRQAPSARRSADQREAPDA